MPSKDVRLLMNWRAIILLRQSSCLAPTKITFRLRADTNPPSDSAREPVFIDSPVARDVIHHGHCFLGRWRSCDVVDNTSCAVLSTTCSMSSPSSDDPEKRAEFL